MEKIDWWSRAEPLTEITAKCMSLDKTNYIKELSKKDLSKLYDEIEEALIDYNLIMEKGPEGFKSYYSMGEGKLESYLEAKLFEVSFMSLIKDSSQKIFKNYLDSFWGGKMKDKEYYNKISCLAGIPQEKQDAWYKLLIESTCSL